MTGIQIIIIILVPVLFQVVYQGYKNEQRYKKLMEKLESLEDKLKNKS